MTDAPQRPRVPPPRSPTWLTFRRVEQTFWTFFILLPIFTGWLAYDWLPNEAFNEKRHEMIRSHEVCQDVGEAEKCGDMVVVWRDKQTGQAYTRDGFAAHRHAERWRMLYVDFGYGLVGCLFFSFARLRENKSVFFHAFGKAVCVNIVVVVVMFLMASE